MQEHPTPTVKLIKCWVQIPTTNPAVSGHHPGAGVRRTEEPYLPYLDKHNPTVARAQQSGPHFAVSSAF